MRLQCRTRRVAKPKRCGYGPTAKRVALLVGVEYAGQAGVGPECTRGERIYARARRSYTPRCGRRNARAVASKANVRQSPRTRKTLP
jgi:hypothetical protein